VQVRTKRTGTFNPRSKNIFFASQTMSFIGNAKKAFSKGIRLTGLWPQFKRDEAGNKTEEVSHLSGKVGSDKDGNPIEVTVRTGDSFKVWPNSYKNSPNAPEYNLQFYPDSQQTESGEQ